MTSEQPAGTGNAISGGTFFGPVIQGRDIQVGVPVSAAQAAGGKQTAGHVFISYVREDSDHVDVLEHALKAAGVTVWRDTANLWPGEDWRSKIRAAITHDALVFIACFSSHSAARRKSYQNEELSLAIEQLRLRRPDDPWLIPVRFDNCDIPDLELGAGRTLTSIQRADLFGAHRDQATERLVAAVQRLLRQTVPSVAEAFGSTADQTGETAVPEDTGATAEAGQAAVQLGPGR
jgi:TIR domain